MNLISWKSSSSPFRPPSVGYLEDQTGKGKHRCLAPSHLLPLAQFFFNSHNPRGWSVGGYSDNLFPVLWDWPHFKSNFLLWNHLSENLFHYFTNPDRCHSILDILFQSFLPLSRIQSAYSPIGPHLSYASLASKISWELSWCWGSHFYCKGQFPSLSPESDFSSVPSICRKHISTSLRVPWRAGLKGRG